MNRRRLRGMMHLFHSEPEKLRGRRTAQSASVFFQLETRAYPALPIFFEWLNWKDSVAS